MRFHLRLRRLLTKLRSRLDGSLPAVVALVLTAGRVADWERLRGAITPQELRDAVDRAPISPALRTLAEQLMTALPDEEAR